MPLYSKMIKSHIFPDAENKTRWLFNNYDAGIQGEHFSYRQIKQQVDYIISKR